jgi:hypothetical protein
VGVVSTGKAPAIGIALEPTHPPSVPLIVPSNGACVCNGIEEFVRFEPFQHVLKSTRPPYRLGGTVSYQAVSDCVASQVPIWFVGGAWASIANAQV